MGVIWPDTSEKIEKMLLEAYDRMSDDELWQQVTELTRAAQQMALVGLREEYPEAGEEELRLRLAALWYGRGLVSKASGWWPG